MSRMEKPKSGPRWKNELLTQTRIGCDLARSRRKGETERLRAMGFFKGIVESQFKRDDQGRDLFYPWSFWGDGYVIDTPERGQRIRSFQTKLTAFTFVTLIVLVNLVGWQFNVVLIPILLLVHTLYFKFTMDTLTEGLEKTDVKLRYGEYLKNYARHQDLGLLIVLHLMMILIFTACLFDKFKGIVVLGILACAISGSLAIFSGYTIKLKVEMRRDSL